MSTLLTVDDSRGMRKMIGIAIRELPDVRLLEAADGRAALELLHHQPVDLITLDLNLPDMDGLDVVPSIRSDSGIRHVPIIMISTRFDAPPRLLCWPGKSEAIRKRGACFFE